MGGYCTQASRSDCSNVASPQKVVIDIKSVFEAAQAYVMLSRVQELEQLYIMKELKEGKMFANRKALG